MYRADFAFMHHSMGRGDDNRLIQYCDLMQVDIPKVGPSRGLALVAISRQGKTNSVRIILNSSTFPHLCCD
jgi:hypothetical protein